MTDPLQQLRELKPQVDWEWATSERGQQVMRRSMDLGALEARSLPTRPRRHSRGVIAAAVAGGAAVVTLGAFSYVSLSEPDGPRQAACYQQLSPDANIIEAPSASVASLGSVQACAQMWRRGVRTPVGEERPVSCISDDGIRGIFPAPVEESSEAACAEIGWEAEKV